MKLNTYIQSGVILIALVIAILGCTERIFSQNNWRFLFEFEYNEKFEKNWAKEKVGKSMTIAKTTVLKDNSETTLRKLKRNSFSKLKETSKVDVKFLMHSLY